MTGANSSRMWLVLGVVAVVAIVAVGGYVILSDDDEGYNWHEGKYQTYQVSGSNGGYTFDGTVKMEITKVEGTDITATTTYDIYETYKGVRTPFIVTKETETFDATEEDTMVWQRSETLSTNWGSKGVDVYLEVEDGISMTMYIDQKNENAIYKMVVVVEGVTLTYTLSSTNYL